MPNPFQIDITARDRTAEGRKSVEKNLERLVKGTSAEKVSKGFGLITEKAKAFQGIAKSLFSMGDSAAIAAGGVGEAATGVGELGAAAGVAGLGVVSLGVGLGVAALAAFKFEAAFTKAGAATGYTAQILGMSTQQLQAFQLAGKRVGVSTEAMTGALQSMGNTMNDAVNGRNQTALALMKKLHIQVHHLKDGSIDAAKGMMDLSDAMVAANAQTKQMIVAQFGVGAAEAFMLQSTRDRKDALADVARSGAIMTDRQSADSQRFQKSVAEMDERWHGLLNTVSQKAIIPWLQPTVDEIVKGVGAIDDLINGTVRWGQLAKGAAEYGAFALEGPVAGFGLMRDFGGGGGAGAAAGAQGGSHAARAAAVGKSFAAVMEYFEATGWSKAQAAGLAANIQNESGFDIHATNPVSGMYGIAQWDTKRRANFARWAGHDIYHSTMAEQLAFMNYELRYGSETRAGHLLRMQMTPTGSSNVVNHDYERNGLSSQDGPRARLAEAAVGGKVHVDVHFHNAPAGTVALASAAGAGITTSAKIAPTMQGPA